jgi:hypothetical protein
MNTNSNDQTLTAFKAYEKAIEHYKFQVGRYNTWMNYYAIFVGALLVALYSIWPKDEVETLSHACNSCCNKITVTDGKSQNWGLLMIISILGWITSMCWYGALLGYRKWNNHCIGVVKKIEGILLEEHSKTTNENLKVYTNHPGSVKYVPGFVSTQKITGIFIFSVALAWVGVLTYILSQWCCQWCCFGFICFILTVIIVVFLHNLDMSLYSSRII